MIPTLQQTQDRLDRLTGNQTETPPSAATAPPNPTNQIETPQSTAPAPPKPHVASTVSDVQRIRVASSMEDVRRTVMAVAEILSTRTAGDRALNLDAEWDTSTSSFR
jgi:hypothetical protein